jgi:hypothetical protein
MDINRIMLSPATVKVTAILTQNARSLVAEWDARRLPTKLGEGLSQTSATLVEAVSLLRCYCGTFLPASHTVSWATALDLTRACTLLGLYMSQGDVIGEVFAETLEWTPPAIEEPRPLPQDCPARLTWRECPVCGGDHSKQIIEVGGVMVEV